LRPCTSVGSAPEYRVAFNAWLKTHPFSNRDAPAGPTFMPEYHNAQTELAAQLDHRSGVTFEAGTKARETADRYARQTVLLATVLFLIAIAQRLRVRAARATAIAAAVGLMLFALGSVIVLPRI
jgi:hypothetical protein